MKRTFILFLFFVVAGKAQNIHELSQYVDPMIGTGGHGHTFPGATVPFGMVQLSPDTRIDGSWDGCSGYHYSDSVIYGFSHTHLSGTGCSDYGDILLFPTNENIKAEDLKAQKFSSKFKHKNEKAGAGSYSVTLDNAVNVELTATPRVGFHKYTFPKSEYSYIILDLELRDQVIDAGVTVISKTKLAGFRESKAWAKDQIVFYDLEFSEPFIEATTPYGALDEEEPFTGQKIRIAFKFKTPASNTILAKVALSPVSAEGAQKNMIAELPGWDFQRTRMEAEAAWNKELGKIEVTSGDNDRLTTFYTALYHTMIQPNIAMDVDGMYRGRDNAVHKAEGFTYYSVFSLWDTFRGAHPLYTIIDQKRTSDFINTFLAQYEQGGRLPVWELASNETDCMIGYHSVSVIADAMVKGVKGFDYEKAFEASKHSAMLDHLGLKAYKEKGFISMEDEHESVSKTVEYAYDDWCIAQMAALLRKPDDYNYFMKRSQSWKNLFDTETGFMRPKKNGGWLTPFDPREVNNNFTEGNSWQYTFFVPHDVYGLKVMLGEGNDKYPGQKLDELFTADSRTTGREQADITGLIGQYAHGNEPSHHMAYLYNYWFQSSKTQERVHQIINDFYKPTPDGLIGNEDCGQMSAWYVLSSIGFYSICPGSTYYSIGTPSFKKVIFNLENNKRIVIRADNVSDKNFYVKNIEIYEKSLLKGTWDAPSLPMQYIQEPYIKDSTVMSFQMSSTPEKWGYYDRLWNGEYSSSVSHPVPFSVVPVIRTAGNIFRDTLVVDITSSGNSQILFSLDGKNYQKYKEPFVIRKNEIVYAKAINGFGLIGDSSEANIESYTSAVVKAQLYKMPHPDWKVEVKSKYNPQYTAGGDEGIIDGLRGETNWRKGEWQGYQSQDFEAVIDLGKKQNLTTFEAGFLQDSRSWIMMPSKVEFYASADNKTFVLIGTETHNIDPKDENIQLKTFTLSGKHVKARYIKVKAINYGRLPLWHQGAGGDAFIFIDEISLK